MTDNFDIISPTLYSLPGGFYHVSLIKRKKDDVKNLTTNSSHVKSYYVNGRADLLNIKDEIISICNVLQCRAYINLEFLSYEEVSKKTLVRLLDTHLYHKTFKPSLHIWDSICAESNRTWFFDVDEDNIEEFEIIKQKMLETFSDFPEDVLFKLKIPSKTGFHQLVQPFDRQKLLHKEISLKLLHTSGVTNLYIP
jgi:hypothetical protein